MKYLLGIGLLVLSLPTWASNPVFLLGKAKLTGTTYTQVVFFYDRDVKDIQTCEREIYYGRNGQWQYYGHMLNRARGFSVNMNYFCRTSSYNISAWLPKARYDNVYQIDVRNDGFVAKPFESYAACLNDLRKTLPDETHDFFCAKANQEVKLADQH